MRTAASFKYQSLKIDQYSPRSLAPSGTTEVLIVGRYHLLGISKLFLKKKFKYNV